MSTNSLAMSCKAQRQSTACPLRSAFVISVSSARAFLASSGSYDRCVCNEGATGRLCCTWALWRMMADFDTPYWSAMVRNDVSCCMDVSMACLLST